MFLSWPWLALLLLNPWIDFPIHFLLFENGVFVFSYFKGPVSCVSLSVLLPVVFPSIVITCSALIRFTCILLSLVYLSLVLLFFVFVPSFLVADSFRYFLGFCLGLLALSYWKLLFSDISNRFWQQNNTRRICRIFPRYHVFTFKAPKSTFHIKMVHILWLRHGVTSMWDNQCLICSPCKGFYMTCVGGICW